MTSESLAAIKCLAAARGSGTAVEGGIDRRRIVRSRARETNGRIRTPADRNVLRAARRCPRHAAIVRRGGARRAYAANERSVALIGLIATGTGVPARALFAACDGRILRARGRGGSTPGSVGAAIEERACVAGGAGAARERAVRLVRGISASARESERSRLAAGHGQIASARRRTEGNAAVIRARAAVPVPTLQSSAAFVSLGWAEPVHEYPLALGPQVNEAAEHVSAAGGLVVTVVVQPAAPMAPRTEKGAAIRYEGVRIELSHYDASNSWD